MPRFVLSALVTLFLIWTLDRSWPVGASRLPPPGRFLDPFHGFWRNAEGPYPEFSPASIPGLQQPVTVHFDSALIPHIYASNDADLFRAQGYVTAWLRLWQMEFQTHAAAGRISEIVGNRALDYDRSQRRFGLLYAAENAYQALQKDEHVLGIAQHYAEGVNAYIRSLDYEELPFEYKLLDYLPEEWTPLKSALLLKSMAQTLNAGSKDVQMTNAFALFGRDTLEMLYPDREEVTDPVVERPGQWSFKPSRVAFVESGTGLMNRIVQMSGLPETDPTVGSNNWAVSGAKTSTGSPILCNDPHLNTTLPSIWLSMHLNSPGINCLGVTIPGSPNIIIGFNDSIAWGMTNAQRDLVDWYQIEPVSYDSYIHNGIERPYRRKIEAIRVRGDETFYDTVTYTHHGPIVFDDRFHPENAQAQYAYRWIAHEDSAMRGDSDAEILTFYILNRARNHTDYLQALDHYASPAQNFVFASVGGDIAMRIQGRFPLRGNGQGRFVQEGWTAEADWNTFIPYEQNVSDKNPDRGFVSSANQYPADSTYPYYITAQSYEAYRNRRINQVLAKSTDISVQAMMDLQNDNFNLKAFESLPLFISLLDESSLSPEEMAALALLKSWDFNYADESEGAPYYEAWWRAVMNSVWDEMRTENGPSLPTPTSYQTIYLLKHYPRLRFYDIVSTPQTETLTDIIRASFSEATKSIEDWKLQMGVQHVGWAEYKDTYIPHLLRIDPLGYHVLHGGGGSIVNASTRTHGPSWRMVVSLEKAGIQAWAVYPGGQSGNPGSAYYANWLPVWADGRYHKLGYWPDESLAGHHALGTLILNSK